MLGAERRTYEADNSAWTAQDQHPAQNREAGPDRRGITQPRQLTLDFRNRREQELRRRNGGGHRRSRLERAGTVGNCMNDRISRMPEDNTLLEKLFLSVATIHQLLIRKNVFAQAEYDAEFLALEVRYRETKKMVQDEALAQAFQAFLNERSGTVQ